MDTVYSSGYVPVSASCIEISDDTCLGSPSTKWEIAGYFALWALHGSHCHESFDRCHLVRVLKGQNIHHCSLLTPNYFLNFGYRGITVAALLDLTIVGIYILVLVPSVMIICYAIVRHIRTGFRPSTIRDRGITDLSLGFERTLRPDAEGSSQDELASAVMANVHNAWSSLKNIGVIELSGIVVVSALWIFQLYVVFRGNVVFDDAEDEFVFRYSYVATSWVFLGMNSYLMLFHLYLGNKHSPVLSMFDLLAEGVKLTFHDRG